MTQEQLKAIHKDAKGFLSRARKAHGRIAGKRERIENWRALAESITAAAKKDGGRGVKGFKENRLERVVIKIADLESEILDDIEELIGFEKEIQAAICELVTDERYKAILELRYLNGFAWNVISVKLHYGLDWVYRLHGSALEEIRQSASLRGF